MDLYELYISSLKNVVLATLWFDYSFIRILNISTKKNFVF